MADRTAQMTLSDGAVLLLPDGTTYALTGELKIDTDIERVRTDRARLPDETWSHTDSNGHTHTYVRDEDDVPRLPSLERRIRDVPCDGSCYSITGGECDGYTVEEWFCRECGVQVDPGFTPDYEASDPGIPITQTSTYQLTAALPLPAAPGGVITVSAGESLFPPIENAEIAWEDPQGNQNRFPMPTLIAGNDMVFTAGSSLVQIDLYGYEMKDIKRKPTGP